MTQLSYISLLNSSVVNYNPGHNILKTLNFFSTAQIYHK